MNFLRNRTDKKNRLLTDKMTNGVRLISAAELKNPVVEQFRTVRTNIDFASVAKGDIKTLLISSSAPSEGKSTINANLAVVYAQQGKKVLLVDADLRRPTVAATFGDNRNTVGLTNYLSDNKKEITDIIKDSGIQNLDIITSGPIPPNPAELLGSGIMTELIDKLKSVYDLVIFDVPPFLWVTDAQVLMSKVDGVAIVVSGGKSKKSDLKRTYEILKLSEVSILGFIYNDKNNKKTGGYGYGYGYNNN
ncbi:CpsD/CapB family tyrosine-protein kinase [Weissella cibaria]|uniref:CpsD/CapB family tyrosine-protein kinase n=1 Tax=Weissella cibaria TaxID=137591 RepID=UPI001C1FA25C|nr:CpsD/CapB family tyrosine-protein kinase [Weissella cibaria]MBU7545399.1 CpsD/CapB family tyrosine-protein kinase [Weissella cibaria]MCV3318708.1 CpsD/CapB family tyrosine-protein kinase [Weissella cibaria]